MEVYESSAPLDEPYGHLRVIPFILSLLAVVGVLVLIFWLASMWDTHDNEARATNIARALVGPNFTAVRFLYEDNYFPPRRYPVGLIEDNCVLLNLWTAESIPVNSSWCDKKMKVPNEIMRSLRFDRE